MVRVFGWLLVAGVFLLVMLVCHAFAVLVDACLVWADRFYLVRCSACERQLVSFSGCDGEFVCRECLRHGGC